MKWGDVLDVVTLGGIAFVVCGGGGALLGGMLAYTSQTMDNGKREALEAKCLAGNDRACRIYEIRWGEQ